jgi:hypothetical protein
MAGCARQAGEGGKLVRSVSLPDRGGLGCVSFAQSDQELKEAKERAAKRKLRGTIVVQPPWTFLDQVTEEAWDAMKIDLTRGTAVRSDRGASRI